MKQLVEALLRNPETFEWECWLTLLGDVIANEAAWMETIRSLTLDEQLDLVERLNLDHTAYSDSLQIITARHADVLDDQVREYLLKDAAESAERFQNRLENHRVVLQTQISTVTARRSPDFDLADEVIRLQARLLHLRSSDDLGEACDSVRELDNQIDALETFSRYLKGYDLAARKAERDKLERETSEYEARKTAFEETIAAAVGRRDQTRRDCADAEAKLAELLAEADALSSQFSAVQDRVASVEEDVRRWEQRRCESDDALAAARRRLEDCLRDAWVLDQECRITGRIEQAVGGALTAASGDMPPGSPQSAAVNPRDRDGHRTSEYDIGIIVHLDDDFARQLNVQAGSPVLFAPILQKWAALPATFDTAECGFYCDITAGAQIELTLLIDDGQDAVHQKWTSATPPVPGADCSVIIDVSKDGDLSVSLCYPDGSRKELEREVGQTPAGRGFRLGGSRQTVATPISIPRITPQQFKAVHDRLRPGGRA